MFSVIHRMFSIHYATLHGKNDFAERSKILIGYREVILFKYQNNYVERSN